MTMITTFADMLPSLYTQHNLIHLHTHLPPLLLNLPDPIQVHVLVGSDGQKFGCVHGAKNWWGTMFWLFARACLAQVAFRDRIFGATHLHIGCINSFDFLTMAI